MSDDRKRAAARVVEAVHGRLQMPVDPEFEQGLAEALLDAYGKANLADLYGRFATGPGYLDSLMRKTIWRALARSCQSGLQVGTGAGFKHPETFEIGSNVFIGAQAFIQGRYDGSCVIGDNVWIGPQAYLDARDLLIEECVGWGPGAKILGSTHSGEPVGVPIIRTALEIRPVRIEAWADVGTNATVLPGVTIGKGAIVGAGAVVASDVPPFAVVAGVPAKFLRWRTDPELQAASEIETQRERV
ncbi:Acetyltransferase (isoleucine patch superfamily) [Mesorhizobium albiziae]|uniref:Acetyltransferase (Isoleucine patch superfamily) n=1 Tax=Neomesorhizobium albiziae TaxID=335020 RepID=A0A1I3XLK5_9HYPH|nr:acyltransferase [Mesorhizobium albiziae]GLS30374.1 hexapeptide transferase [Mesorhizobium albiziae]SFK19916.1 Acetyltransferase (isoleucine patch superfamily) [Mesorhizobium albiziae]